MRTDSPFATWWRGHARPLHWREASLCVPALPLLLCIGLATGHAASGAVAAGAAYSVGFGASRDLRGRRWGAMIAAMLGMTVAAFVGSLAGQFLPMLILLAGLAAAGCAALALFDEDLWWIALQIVIAFLVAGYYPGHADAGLERAATVLGGGLVQVAIVAMLAWLVPRGARILSVRTAKARPSRRLLVTHVARAALCIPLAIVAAEALGLANSYWAPMTALIVLKPGLHETQARGIARVAGTLVGCGAATIFAIATGYSEVLLVTGIALAAGLSFAWQKAHYATLSAAISATVVLLLSLGHGGVIANVEHRLVATIVGGVLALCIARIAPHRPPAETGAQDALGGA